MSRRSRRGTCDGCGRVRKLTYPKTKYVEGTIIEAPGNEQIHYYGLCSECFPRVSSQDDIKTLRAERREREKTQPKKRYRKAYVCIGGPLDGAFASTFDFYSDGMYAHLGNEYFEFNSAGHARASMIFVHKSMIQQPISARVR